MASVLKTDPPSLRAPLCSRAREALTAALRHNHDTIKIISSDCWWREKQFLRLVIESGCQIKIAGDLSWLTLWSGIQVASGAHRSGLRASGNERNISGWIRVSGHLSSH